MAAQNNPSLSIGNIAKQSDALIAFVVVGVVFMMIVPLPSTLLSILLTLNITISLVVLLVAIYTLEPLQFSVFPTLLLLTTLFRLSLNVSTTRLILLKGNAGAVIEAFGNFVVGGNAVVGFIVFLILVVIQFIVITRGAERVAEVAARFTLDAMPGKQMSIDADLNAGIITDQEARKRRSKIQREADFYGAMDGASKFVKGDAIAGIIIIVINTIGGFIIGMVQGGLGLTEALQRYTLLTVGDGLVTQIPALLISTATGIVVTRAASEENLGRDLAKQIFGQPRVLLIAAGVLFFLGIIPGMPQVPFLTLAAIMGTIGYIMRRTVKEAEALKAETAADEGQSQIRKPENVVSLLQIDPLELEIGYSLIPLVDPEQGGDLLDRVTMIRRQCALELGLIVPPIRIRDNMQLKPGAYVIKIKGVEVANGELLISHYLAMDSGVAQQKIEGIATSEPAFGLPALWISEEQREQAEMAGYTVVDLPSVVATHLTEVIKKHADEILGRQEVQSLIDNLKQTYPTVIEELIPDLMTMGEVQKILQNLLWERISIRDLVTILEALADNARFTKDPDTLTEYVRQALSRQITRQYQNENGKIFVITLDNSLEELINNSIQRTEHGAYLAIDPSVAQQIYSRVNQEVERVTSSGYQPLVLCAPLVRLYFKRFIDRVTPNLPVISYNELEGNIEVQSVGTVSI